MNKKIKAKYHKYSILYNRYSHKKFFMRVGRFHPLFGGEVILRYAKLVDARKFMAFARLFDRTYG